MNYEVGFNVPLIYPLKQPKAISDQSDLDAKLKEELFYLSGFQ